MERRFTRRSCSVPAAFCLCLRVRLAKLLGKKMIDNFDDWATWQTKTGFHRQVQASLEKHRVSRNVTPDEYIASKRTQLAQQLEGKILIYLDTKHWVNMCNVVVQSKQSLPIYGEVLGQLERLRQKKTYLLPSKFHLVRGVDEAG